MATLLTERARTEQLAVRSTVVRDIARLWPLLDPRALDATFPAYATAVAPVVRRGRETSAELSARYLQQSKAAAGVDLNLEVVLAKPLETPRLTAALRVTSVVAVKRAASRGIALDLALQNALAQSAGAASRLVLDAGRETIQETVRREPRAGWQRVTSGRACAFCQMLADRGAVYTEETSDFQSHDSCGCSAEVVFR